MNGNLKKWVTLIGVAVLVGVLSVALLGGTALAQGPGPWSPHGGFGWGHGPGMMGSGIMGSYGYGGMMGGHGGMMGGYSHRQPTGEMTVSPDEAVQAAQSYLDRIGSGLTADDHADPFYGYYTLHTLRDGQVVGMLSVNGYTGQVWYHTWHGDFVGMTEGHE